MKAMVINRHGGPEVLEPADLPEPVPAPGEVLVRVRACALNHLDPVSYTHLTLPTICSV